LRFGSVCSGIEAASVAWEPLGWRAAWFSEIEKFPSAVLAHHYPDTPNLGDMTRLRDRDDLPRIDLLVGGTPCQSFSVAGLRGGLDDERGNLALEFCRLAGRSRPRWIVWENVPGVLSSSGGRDFASIVGALAELGYGLAWRVLDAQYFGVPQRRRRVFLVGHLGDWRPAGAVLFERESLCGHPPPSREAREGASSHTSHSLRGEGFDASEDGTGRGVPIVPIVPDVAYAISCGSGGSKFGSGRHNQDTLIATTVVNARETPVHTSDLSLPLGAQDTGHAVAFQQNYLAAVQDCRAMSKRQNGAGINEQGPSYTLDQTGAQGIITPSQVRRLTPVECERLQGFPDDYTAIPWRGKAPEDCPDGPRYKALGNSMAVPVMRWIGERIAAVDATL